MSEKGRGVCVLLSRGCFAADSEAQYRTEHPCFLYSLLHVWCVCAQFLGYGSVGPMVEHFESSVKYLENYWIYCGKIW